MRFLVEDLKVIYFLADSKKLPPFYVHLASQLKKLDYELVPVTMDQFLKLRSRERLCHLVIFLQNSPSFTRFIQRYSFIIKNLVLSRQCNIFCFSSFESHKFNVISRSPFFHYHSLPLRGTEVAKLIWQGVYEAEEQAEKWPYGRRGSFQVASDG